MSEIKRHIRHQNAYKGGGTYGLFGGYDITLLELQRPFHGYKPACLPSPTFDDIRLEKNDSILAGFGAYHRNEGNTCQTNEFGKMKYHYCDSRSGNGSDACQNDSPPTMSQECDEFFKDKSTPNSFPTGVEEIRIIGGAQDSRTAIENGAPGIFCFPKNNPEKKEYGWCRTLGHYYQADIPGMDMNPLYSSWGFCSKECYLDNSIKNLGILRDKQRVQILPEELCQEHLRTSLRPKVKYHPQILCIAKTHKWKESVWEKTGEGYKEVKPLIESKRFGKSSYVASQGTCVGDSGGPAFVHDEDRFVLTGEIVPSANSACRLITF